MKNLEFERVYELLRKAEISLKLRLISFEELCEYDKNSRNNCRIILLNMKDDDASMIRWIQYNGYKREQLNISEINFNDQFPDSYYIMKHLISKLGFPKTLKKSIKAQKLTWELTNKYYNLHESEINRITQDQKNVELVRQYRSRLFYMEYKNDFKRFFKRHLVDRYEGLITKYRMTPEILYEFWKETEDELIVKSVMNS